MNEDANKRLRCRPGDTARVVDSSNDALIGRTVEVAQLHFDGRWECVLEGGAVIGLADDGMGLLLTRDWLFPDCCLEPKHVRHREPLSALAESLAA
ncbi:hypothetical protein CN645_30385 [Burkholderia sp. IDO3]|nr:hypothetical protein DCN14_01730 [Burkholderia sp. IDO3]PCD58193.1 hypothetical protein CN645_30385 [Burkholderia sp. IDO3]